MFSEYTIARIIGYSYLIPNPYALDYGCYILVDASWNWVVFGSTNDSAYDATLDQVEDVLQSGRLKS